MNWQAMIDVIKKIVLGACLAAIFGMFGYASVCGLRGFLADQPLFAVVFGSGLEASKLALVVGTHRQWPALGPVSKLGRSIAISALIITTSAGVLGFMWLSHNVSTGEFQRLESRAASLKNEAAQIGSEIKTLDDTIKNWPETWVTKRLEARKSIEYDKKRARLQEIDRELGSLKTKKTIEYSGPVFATASIIRWVPERIAKWYVLWLVVLGEFAGFWMMILNSRAWEPMRGVRPAARGERIYHEGHEYHEDKTAANMPDGKNGNSGQNTETAEMPDYQNGKVASGERRETGEAQPPVFKAIAGNAENGGKYAVKYAAAEMPAKTANMPDGKYAETANMPANVPGKNGRNAGQNAETAEMPKSRPGARGERREAGRENAELLAIMERHGLAAEDVMLMTGRSKIGTVNQWLRGEAVIPEKALRGLRRRVAAGLEARG